MTPYNQIPEFGGSDRIVHDGPVTWNLGQTGLPFADDSIFDYMNSHRHYDATFEWMNLEEFMTVQWEVYLKFGAPHEKKAPLSYEEYWTKTVTQRHVDNLIQLMEKGTVFTALAIELDKQGKLLDFQEGRHRSMALKQLGIKKIPVWIVKKRF